MAIGRVPGAVLSLPRSKQDCVKIMEGGQRPFTGGTVPHDSSPNTHDIH